MASVDIVIPSGRGILAEAHQFLALMMRSSLCTCGNHEPWKCPNGKHAPRLVSQGGSIVHWARNQVLALALYGPQDERRPPAEYFLLMDDDMVAKPGDLCRLLSYRADIVTGISTIRRDPPIPNIRNWSEEKGGFETIPSWDWNSQKLIPIGGVGAAFMLVKRRVLEKLAEAWLTCHFERQEDKRKYPNMPAAIDAYWDEKSARRCEGFEQAHGKGDFRNCDAWWFQFIQNAHDLQVGEFGEDLSFCYKATHLGFKIFADPQVTPGHLGLYAYSLTDYIDSLEGEKQLGYVIEDEKKGVLQPAEV